MRPSRPGALLTVLFLGGGGALQAQAAARPLPTWHAALPTPGPAATHGWGDSVRLSQQRGLGRGSHLKTGLLVGGLIGVAATTVFLIGFCDDPDARCGADEVGRAVVIIAVPAAALGALIGSLIHKEER